MPPGGKFKDIDGNNPLSTAIREGLEESGLSTKNGVVIAKLEVAITEKRQRLIITAVLFKKWYGRVCHNHEFEWLDFIPISAILKDKLLPCDADWMQRVLCEDKPSKIIMACGESREDVIDFHICDLS